MTEAKKATEPSAAHKLLHVFVGKWRFEGQSFAEGQQPNDPRASAVAWKGEDTWAWLPGGFFLRHEGHSQLGAHTLISTEIIGYDKTKGGYFSHMYENAGFHPEYLGKVDGKTWTFAEASSRSRMVFSDDNRKIKIDWEWRNDGSNWLPLCDLVATRIDE